MGKYKNNIISYLLCSSILLSFAAEANTCEPWVAMAISVQGTAQLRIENDGQETWKSVQLGHTFCTKDILRVRENSRIALILNNDTVVRLDENTTITFSELSPDSDSSMDLKEGIAHFISRVKQAFKVITPFVNAAIEGTEFVVKVDPDQAQVTVFEGVVKAENEKGQVRLTQGQTAIALKDQAPVLKTLVKPRNAVQWALYYPPIIQTGDIDSQLAAEVRDKLAQSMMLNAQGKATDALNVIDNLPDDLTNPDVYSYRAAMRLAVGRVNKASKDIERALSIKNDDSSALALKSIIAIVEHQIDNALSLATQAVDSDDDNQAAYLALSYAQQASFDLEAALQTIKDAPAGELVYSRRAELYLMQGNFEKGLYYADKAIGKNPDSSHAQTVLGFAHLIQIDTDNARKAFNHAIMLDQPNPLAHMGLGLTLIRKGELKEGRREIEYAASLDPNNALIRSYLGKAYYEEGRNKVAADQFDMAKALDPNDPTPWFYSAIQKESENDLVGGMNDLQKSIDLNDNRAVYRSKLLLDSDDAARNVSMANLYRDLGFDQLGTLEARKSINQEPDNYSAHRYLADSYLTKPRHEIARVSELMQSQLLQPLNVLPIQPQLAESSLGIVHGTGGLRPGLNEYNSLFTQDQFALFVNGLAGTFGTRANDVVHSGLIDNFSYSLGSYHYYSQGFRENNDQDYAIDNVFLQVAASPNTSLQFEYRKFKHRKGDTTLKFDPTDYSTTFREYTESEVFRIGFSHLYGANSRLIGSFVNEDLQVAQQVSDSPPAQDVSRDGNGTLYEFQHIYSQPTWNLVSGIGGFRADTKTIINLDFSPFPCLLPSCTSVSDVENVHDNIYLYSNIKSKNYTVTLGLSADSVKNEVAEFDETNPKLGILWNINESSTLRAAVFKTVKRDLLTDQTVEPTHVAGFNQFYDDDLSTKATVTGIGIDTKHSTRLFTGISATQRDLETPYVNNASITAFSDRRELSASAYLNWIVTNNYAFNAGINYEKYERSLDFPWDFLELETYSIPLNISLFAINATTVNINPTYVLQEGDFYNSVTLVTTPGKDEFWVFNVDVEYKLPETNGYLIFGAKNLLNEEFNYYEIDTANPSISRERFGYVRLELEL